MARIIAERMSVTLGHNIIVDNRGGAGGTIAARAFVQAPPDGYTIFLGYSGTIAVAPSMYQNVGFDPRKDFAPIAILGGDAGLRRPARALAAALERAAGRPAYPAMAARLGRLHRLTAGRMARLRRSALLREHVGLVAPREVFDLTDALRWLERVFHHAERIVHYGAVAAEEEPTREEAGREDSASA